MPSALIVYLNRLSDLLFVLARVVNHRARVCGYSLEGTLSQPGGSNGNGAVATDTRFKARSCSSPGAVGWAPSWRRCSPTAARSIAMTYHTSRAGDRADHRRRSVQRRRGDGRRRGPLRCRTRPQMRWPRSPRDSAALTHWSTWPAFTGERRFADSHARDFDQMIAANLAAPYHTAVAAARQMLTQEAKTASRARSSTSATGPPIAPTRIISLTSWPRGAWRP